MLVPNTVGNFGMHNMIRSRSFVGTEGHYCRVACNTAGHNTLGYSNHFLNYKCSPSYSSYFCCFYKNYFCSSHCSSFDGFDFCSLGTVCSLNCRSSLLRVVDVQLVVDVFLRYQVVILAYTNNSFEKDGADRSLVDLDDLDLLDNSSCNNLGFHSNCCTDSLPLLGCLRSYSQYWVGYCKRNCCNCLVGAGCRRSCYS